RVVSSKSAWIALSGVLCYTAPMKQHKTRRLTLATAILAGFLIFSGSPFSVPQLAFQAAVPIGGLLAFGGAAEQDGDDVSPEQRAEIQTIITRYEVAHRGVVPTDASPTPYPFFPQGGTLWQDLLVNNFVDLDDSSGILDWDCTSYTYDGHRG